MAERILNLTLEIIYLLTGEDYSLGKKSSSSSDCVRSSCYVSIGWGRTQSPVMMTPSHSFLHEENKQKILGIIYKIIELLTGEVPIRCQDVAVYFSMEEWEYLEGHLDLYKDVMMENHQPPTSPDHDKKNPLERDAKPLHSLDCPEKNHYVPLDHQSEDVVNIKVEVPQENFYIMGNHHCKEEEMNGCPADDVAKISVGHCLLPYYEAEREDITHHSFFENSITPDIPLVLPSADISSDLTQTLCDQLQFGYQSKGHKEGKTFICYECGKSYKNAFNLYMHKRIHRDERPFSCSECGKSFTKKSVLVEHHRVHTGEKPYSCTECGKCFTRKSILVEHQRSHTGDKPFLCMECGRCFARKSHLERHLRTHTGEKPFSCSKCEKRFIQKIHLLEHQKVHTKNKLFTCLECGKCFIQKTHLVNHQKTHTLSHPNNQTEIFCVQEADTCPKMSPNL